MVDPINFTNFNLNEKQLQEYILFAIAVAGKNATTIAKILEKFLQYAKKETKGKDHFDCISKLVENNDLADILKKFGFGCFKMKSKGFIEIAQSGFDLKTCTVEELETITGIGFKTSRFFVMHTRRKANIACLDVHILRWMRKRGYKNIPKQTPSSKKQYLNIENKFLNIAKRKNINPADLDLKIWIEMSKNSKEKI